MKNYIIALMALIMLALPSCQNDDIEIHRSGNLTINVSTVDLYEQLQMKTHITKLLGEYPSDNIGVLTLLYDENGQLIKKEQKNVNTLQSVNFSFDGLLQGDYTIVVLQTLVDKDNGYTPIYWELVDEGNLSKLRLNTKSYKQFWCYSVGCAVNAITVSENKSVKISPKSLGCIVRLGYENFQKSDLVSWELALANAARGIYLDPNAKIRYFYEEYMNKQTMVPKGFFYEESGITEDYNDFFILECGLQEYCLGGADAEQYADNKFTPYSGIRKFDFKIGEKYAAYTIYDPNSRKFNFYMGDISGLNEWKERITQSIKQVVFKEPCLQWGTSVDNIRSIMNDYEVGNNGELVADEDGTYVLWYNGKYKV